ncbi:hypothetical protein BP5796_02214 [Coleophoma crateriformis]|uniref:Major facilitator superfamily (MFS) profile domain-containing protein n=1 Tax=Coleophoma crateriformis TaxID=565419 RepID=A0A3D8SXR1_9HELO|nr:hypothetical protein BP5796_02214 [Coleophoma crateriformis]
MSILSAFNQLPMVRELTPRLFFVYMFMSNFGFDNGWWASVISLQQFADRFGVYDPSTGKNILPSSWQSAGSGTGNAGLAIGCIIAGPIISKIGRKYTVLVIIAFALTGMLIQNVVPSFWGVMVGRMINSISMGLEANNIPMFMAELAPPAARGSLVNFYQWWQLLGVLMSQSTVYKSNLNFPHGQWSYRTVMVVQMIIPLLLCGVFFILPESPRWLLSKGRRDHALAALIYLRKGASTEKEVEEELRLTEQAVEEQERFHKATTYMDCFRGSNGRRTMIATGSQVLEQLSGNAFMSSYAVIFLKQVGIVNPLAATMARVGMSVAGATIAFFAADKIGRRPLMMVTAVIMWIGLWVSAGVSGYKPGGVHGGAAAQGLLACQLIWSLCSTLGWGCCVWMITAEVGTAQLREKTVSIATTFSFIAVLLVSYISPFIQNSPGNLGAKIGFVYGSFSLVAVFFVYFFVPELSNRSLEELDELFQNKVPAWRFKSYKATGVGVQITQIQNINADKGLTLIEAVNTDEEVGESTSSVGEGDKSGVKVKTTKD